MDNNLLKKWETLLASLNVSNRSELICPDEQIAQAEKELGFRFPAGYPEYCRVFGSGSLGQGDAPEFFRIYCPCCPPSSFDIRRTGHDLIGLKLGLDADGPLDDGEKEKMLRRLLESGYAFGGTDRAESFMWDLTTYSEADRSYDIYRVPVDSIEESALVGRDFFKFVSEFCLGGGWKIMFPEEDRPDTTDAREGFFAAFAQHGDGVSEGLFQGSLFERFWDDLTRATSFTKSEEIQLTCGYDAPGKEQAERLLRAWGQDEGVEVKVVAASDRPNIPRLIDVTVTVGKGKLTREYTEGLLRKMIKAGEECDCPVTSVGSGTVSDG
jgi:hypothetical protein